MAAAAVATAATMLALDLTWLGVIARGLYDSALAPLKRPEVLLPAAGLFYALYLAAILVHAVLAPPLRPARPGGAQRWAWSPTGPTSSPTGASATGQRRSCPWTSLGRGPDRRRSLRRQVGVRRGSRGHAGMNGAGPRAPGRRDESLRSIWSRRAISLPAYALLGALTAVTLPLWVLGGLAVDVLTGRARLLPRTRALAFFALYLGCELVGVAAAAGLWLVSLGGRVGGAARYVDLNAALQRWWTAALFGEPPVSSRCGRRSKDWSAPGRVHCSCSFVTPARPTRAGGAALVANPNRLLLRYVLKQELPRDPCLDIVGRRLPNAFIDRRSPRSQGEIEAIARLARDLDSRSAVLIYPEGTRFSPEKLASAVETLRGKGKGGLAEVAAGYRNVLPPRVGGPLALLDAAPGVDLLLVEHTGFEGAASFAEFWRGTLVGKTLRVKLRRIPATEIPQAGRDRWLFERWSEVDRWISAQVQGAP